MPDHHLPSPPRKSTAAEGPAEPLPHAPVALRREACAQRLAVQHAAQRLPAALLELGLVGHEPGLVEPGRGGGLPGRHRGGVKAHDAQ
eukprot:9477839-Pyramimonas_sp.AAC.1